MDNELIVVDEKAVNTSITTYDNQLLGYLNELGLPTQNILVSVDERWKVIKNLETNKKNFVKIGKKSILL